MLVALRRAPRWLVVPPRSVVVADWPSRQASTPPSESMAATLERGRGPAGPWPRGAGDGDGAGRVRDVRSAVGSSMTVNGTDAA